MQETISCKNCNNLFAGKFCNQCGEKVYKEEDKKIKKIAEEAAHFITHFDGSFLTTLKTSLTKPGRLSADYCNGIRKKYFKPIPFFLLLVVLYLLFPRFKGLNMIAGTYTSSEYDFTWFSIPVFNAKMKKYDVSFEEIAKRYDEKSPRVSKFFLLLLIPLSSGVMALLFINKRKPFFDHFILSAEILSFYIFLQFLVLPFFAFVMEKINPQYSSFFYDGSWVDWITSAVLGIFTIIAVRNFYKDAYWVSVLKGLLFFLLFMIVIKYIYSILVFLITMLFV